VISLEPNRVRVVTIRGTRVRVSVRGTGKPLLLVMGIGGSLDMWHPLERSLNALGYQTIAFDLPGSGASPAVFPPRRMPGLARIALGVLSSLKVERADVLGVSFGGIVAQEIARLAGPEVGRVVLAATGPGLGGVPASPRVLMHMATPLRYWLPGYAQRISPLIYGGAARRGDNPHGRMAARFERPPSMLGYAGQLYAISLWSSLPWLRRVHKPVLLLHGDDDPIVPLPNARLLARLLPDARLVVLEGSGHLFLLDEPEMAAHHVDDFLRR
jgi:poly(3-hydroxyoctanoate) depolymerase